MGSNLLFERKNKSKAQLQNIFVVTAEDNEFELVDMTHILQHTAIICPRLSQAHGQILLLRQIFHEVLLGKLSIITVRSKTQHSPVTVVTELHCNHFVLNRREKKNNTSEKLSLKDLRDELFT